MAPRATKKPRKRTSKKATARRADVLSSLPFTLSNENMKLTATQRKAMLERIEDKMADVLSILHIDYKRDHNTRDTPKRYAKMLLEVFKGRFEAAPDLRSFDNVSAYDDMIMVGPMEVRSFCSHHFLPIVGHAYISVLPHKGKPLIGLSKYPRIVEHYARRPQIQEELTRQILRHVETTMEPEAAGVILDCRHFCMCHRGVGSNALMRTTAFSNEMRKAHLSHEFYAFISKHAPKNEG